MRRLHGIAVLIAVILGAWVILASADGAPLIDVAGPKAPPAIVDYHFPKEDVLDQLSFNLAGRVTFGLNGTENTLVVLDWPVHVRNPMTVAHGGAFMRSEGTMEVGNPGAYWFGKHDAPELDWPVHVAGAIAGSSPYVVTGRIV